MREFRWCRQELAEFCDLTEDHTHVCITTPEYRMIRPACGKRHINFRFHDLLPAELPANTPQARRDGCFTEVQAREIRDFINQTETLVIVNCEAGISRSAGVVLALRWFHGGNTEEIFQKAHPNGHVAAVMEKVLRE